MGYCFMSVEKIHNYTEMNAKYMHNYRTVDVMNADKGKKDLNHEVECLPFTEEFEQMNYYQTWRKRIDELPYYQDHKVRSNGVLAYEVVMTFSREENLDIGKWEKTNAEWLHETFDVAPDGKSNVLSIVYHGDEAGNVHLHALVTPVDENGKLNARRFTGGDMKMKHLQNTYSEKMEQFGLKRGIENSRAKHKDIKRMYIELNQDIAEVLKNKDESPEEYVERIQEHFKDKSAVMLKQKLDNERKMEEKITRQQNREMEAIKKQLEASKALAQENLLQLNQACTDYKRKKKRLEEQISGLTKEIDSLKFAINEKKAELYKLNDSVHEKAEKYDYIMDSLSILEETDQLQAQELRKQIEVLEKGNLSESLERQEDTPMK